ncbi:unnamed protein product [Prorocentrum cordatum]|uniref:Uncharacterized protein n=1 Tax=Prorocentrum cordatum TaxID=2364126 RepID=A0ABN9U6H3_9DINO|nr:unnamed protein product [Polarella glacialis]
MSSAARVLVQAQYVLRLQEAAQEGIVNKLLLWLEPDAPPLRVVMAFFIGDADAEGDRDRVEHDQVDAWITEPDAKIVTCSDGVKTCMDQRSLGGFAEVPNVTKLDISVVADLALPVFPPFLVLAVLAGSTSDTGVDITKRWVNLVDAVTLMAAPLKLLSEGQRAQERALSFYGDSNGTPEAHGLV